MIPVALSKGRAAVLPVKETTITKSIIKLLQTVPSSFVRKIHSGSMQGPGLPDVYFSCKALDGRAVWFEVKCPGKVPTKIQVLTMKKLNRAGCSAVVVTSVAEVRLWLERESVEYDSSKRSV